MRLYGPDELRRFLRGIDKALESPQTVILIGMGAACVHYHVPLGTRDLDTWSTVGRELRAAARRAEEATGLAVPFKEAGVTDAPYEFESRLRRALPRLRRLTLMVPEKHDLALMKVTRGEAHDLDGIVAIHQESRLSLTVLVRRYREEMGAVIGDPVRIRRNFLNMIDRLFPDKALRVEKEIE